MKYLTFAVVFLGTTGALAAFRGLAWHPADAARAPEVQAGKAEASARTIDRTRPDGAALDFLLVNGGDAKDRTGGEKQPARLAADCATHLYEKAKKQPDNVRLLEQAAAHYRACLSHEPTVEDAGALFADARKNLEQIEKALARLKSRETPKPAPVAATPAPRSVEKSAEKAPAAAKKDEKPTPAPAPARAKEQEESLMVGPDGTVFRKERSGD